MAREKATGVPLPAPALRRALRRALGDWFARARRPLPWRRDYDPYGVWVSEMMLQQTQVETVLPYYRRWMERFPDVAALAAAPEADVLKAWEGLGYYARARNLHAAAREVVRRHGGRLPADAAALRALPGIGPYTAGAIASIAFNAPEPAVDGNVARVLSRLFALPQAPREPAGARALHTLAAALVPRRGARDFNQGLMELGALVCRDRAPQCLLCPLRRWCRASAEGSPERYPPRARRPERPRVDAVMALVEAGGRWLLRRRPPRGLWGGLWEWPWAERKPGEPPEEALARLLAELGLEPAEPAALLGTVRHELTHREFEWHCYRAPAAGNGRPAEAADADGGALRWVAPAGFEALPLGRPMQKARDLLAQHGAA